MNTTATTTTTEDTMTAKTTPATRTDIHVTGDVRIGQTVTVEGVTYKVTEINLAHPAFPVLTAA